jgi:PAS domain S-box-containing protein
LKPAGRSKLQGKLGIPAAGGSPPSASGSPPAARSGDAHAGNPLYETLLNALPSSVLMIGRDLRVAFASRHFLLKSRRTNQETLGRRLAEVFPEAILERTNLLRGIQSVFETRKPIAGDRIIYRAPSGVFRVYCYRIIHFSDPNQVEFALLVIDDVTGDKAPATEAGRLAPLAEKASEIILSTDLEGRICGWNHAAEQATGYTAQEVQGRCLYEFCAPEHQAGVRRLFCGQQPGQSPPWPVFNLLAKSGLDLPVAWICSAMIGGHGETTGVMAVGRSFTGSGKPGAESDQAEKLATLGRVSGGLAHELRNPLAVCSAAAQFLMEEEIEPEFRRDCAQKVRQGMQRVSHIIRQLLHFAQLPEGMDIVRVDLPALVKETLALFAEQVEKQGIDLQLRLPEAPVFVQGDAHLLQQVFLTLFFNALLAMPAGGQLRVTAAPDASQVCVQVADTGSGLAAEDVTRLFDPLSPKATGQKEGVFSLPLCYAIAARHGGTMEVASAPGQGTTFILRLNLSQV